MSGDLVFYEKPGCIGNQRQRALLRARGITLDVRDLLSADWSEQELRRFFGSIPIRDWFNQSAPAVKSGDVDIGDCSESEALRLMLQDPILIRRPLLQIGDIFQSGFVDGPVLTALGVSLHPGHDMQSCPMDDASPRCGEPT
ncbi:MAG: ArsC/Spx/MgsR family protein [Gammaproteobacteria bacterium]|nr:ArsC/Spx/MgsR family protein [Gammaproteobacteria bacterium]